MGAIADVIQEIKKSTAHLRQPEHEIQKMEGWRFNLLYVLSFLLEFVLCQFRTLFFMLLILPFLLAPLMLIFPFVLMRFISSPQGFSSFASFMGWGIWGWWTIAWVISCTNVTLSVLALWGVPTGGFLTRWALGARTSSRRESQVIADVLGRLAGVAPAGTNFHDSWWVIDNIRPNTYTVGTTLYVTTGALADRRIDALIAHEIGHFNQKDGARLKALRNFVYPVAQHIFTRPKTLAQAKITDKTQTTEIQIPTLGRSMADSLASVVFVILFGGLSILVFGGWWSQYFRQRDYLADDFAYSVGLGGDLVNFLDENRNFDVPMPFFDKWTPYAELRIDRLLIPRP